MTELPIYRKCAQKFPDSLKRYTKNITVKRVAHWGKVLFKTASQGKAEQMWSNNVFDFFRIFRLHGLCSELQQDSLENKTRPSLSGVLEFIGWVSTRRLNFKPTE